MNNPNTDPLYYTDSDGVRWRVYDACYGPPLAPRNVRRVVPLGDARANTRSFVSAGGVLRCAPRKRTEPHATDGTTLARLFSAAGFVAQSPSHIVAKRPR
jgi:hypothetical protein